MDLSVPDIYFDTEGVCNFCKIHDQMEINRPLGEEGEKRLENIFSRIRKDGKNRKYDCIVGVSGGRDSTYTLYLAIKNGLRPLAVHFDNGWNSDIANENIRKTTDKLGVDLFTHAADWGEFKDLQKSFLHASVSDAEVPTDYVILSVLYMAAKEYNVKYILNGHSFRTEGIVPMSWTYIDGKYIRSVHKIFGTLKLKSFPIMRMSELIYNTLIRKIKVINIPEHVEYEQRIVDAILKSELDWTYSGGHHHESVYTEFFQSYYLPSKFGIDKRKLEFSALIRSGQMCREQALEEVGSKYPYDRENVNYTIDQLEFTSEEFEMIMQSPKKTFRDYPTYYGWIRMFRWPIKIACNLGLLPHVFHEKYLGHDVK